MLEQIIAGMQTLAEYDFGLKSGNKSPDEGIERMLFSIYGII